MQAPSGLTATGVSGAQIDLSWTDDSTNETAFYIERSPDGSTGWTEIGSVGANVTTYADTDLTCATTYFYRVRAYRSGDGQYSAYSDGRQRANDQRVPAATHRSGQWGAVSTITRRPSRGTSVAWAATYRIPGR